jgi:hypothetical protein
MTPVYPQLTRRNVLRGGVTLGTPEGGPPRGDISFVPSLWPDTAAGVADLAYGLAGPLAISSNERFSMGYFRQSL